MPRTAIGAACQNELPRPATAVGVRKLTPYHHGWVFLRAKMAFNFTSLT